MRTTSSATPKEPGRLPGGGTLPQDPEGQANGCQAEESFWGCGSWVMAGFWGAGEQKGGWRQRLKPGGRRETQPEAGTQTIKTQASPEERVFPGLGWTAVVAAGEGREGMAGRDQGQ